MVTGRLADTMRKFKIEILGAWLAMATGTLVMMVVAALLPLVAMINFFGMLSEEPKPRPYITVGLSGWLYSLAIIALGALALSRPKWGGVGLAACALAGYLLGTGNLTVPLLLLTAAILCLAGCYQHA
jgi:hypothetical protein